MSIRFVLASGSDIPIFRQIVEQVKLGIINGDLNCGDKLPSLRNLAEQLFVNPNTVAKAYAELTHDGLIQSRKGRGVFITDQRPLFIDSERNRRLEQSIDHFLSEVLILNFSNTELMDKLQSRIYQQDEKDDNNVTK